MRALNVSSVKHILRVSLAFVIGGYMLLDGVYATETQTYIGGVTGPWAGMLHFAGFSAYSSAMYDIFIGFGILWLLAIVLYFFHLRETIFVMAVLSLWYVPVGAILALVIMATYMRARARA